MTRTQRRLVCLVVWNFALPASSGIAIPGGEQAIEPKLNEISLVIGAQTQKPVRTTPSWNWEHAAGEYRVVVNQDSVSVRKPSTREVPWSAKSVDGEELAWMDSTDSIAYLIGYVVDDKGRFSGYGKTFGIRRLDLSSRKWLAEITLQDDTTQQNVTRDILQVIADNQFVVVLTSLVDRDSADDDEAPLKAYALTCFRENETLPTWSISVPAIAKRRYTGALLWAARKPQYAASSIQHLSRFDDRLLVCTEARQPILCLNIDTGTELWRCERIWEYQRGFIGPSVYSHYIQRFGIESSFGRNEDDEREFAAAEEAFNAQFDCSLIGGPVSVPIRTKRDSDTHSIFVAISKEPAKAFGGYLADSVIYELNNDGEPISMVNVPQLVFGSQFQQTQHGLIWKCHNNGLLKLQPSRHTPVIGMGPGGSDLLTRIDWFRQMDEISSKGWLIAGRSGDPFAFGDGFAVRIPGGGFIEKQDEAVYQFPLSIIDLSTGSDRTMMLRVPFHGEFSIPKTNFRTTEYRGENAYRTIGPWLLAVTNLSVVGTRLEVALGMKDWCTSIEFDLDLKELLKEGTVSQRENSNELQIDAQNINVPDERGNTPLMEHAKDIDTSQIKALLAAGADVNARSDVGWSTLMSAACYGTLETVELLVEAGADVNIADKNCGGQTILMWAARSGRESKQKVKILLRAGADPEQTSDSGWNVLMSATSNGNLETVELLLGNGFDVTTRSEDGTTVLMAAILSADPTLIKVLLQAGADVNATDSNGRTPLMRAAMGFDSGEIVRLLIDAGADPHRKDNDGHTALDLTHDSDNIGAESRAKVLEASMKPGTND